MHTSNWHTKKNILVTLTAILSILNGLAYLFFPGFSAGVLGVRPDSYGLHITRYYGACALGYAVLLWWLRKDETRSVSQGLLWSIFILLGISVIIGIIGLVNGVTNLFGLQFVLIDLVLSVGSFSLLITLREQ